MCNICGTDEMPSNFKSGGIIINILKKTGVMINIGLVVYLHTSK